MRDHTKAFKRLARATDSLVLILHHCNEEDASKQKGDRHPPARGRITGKVAQKAENVWTLWYEGPARLMHIAPVKIRDSDGDGVDDTGRTYMTIRSDPERMQFFDMQHQRLGGAA